MDNERISRFMLGGLAVVIMTDVRRARRHRKKRIDKKWEKRYGYIYQDLMPYDKIIHKDGVLYMTLTAWQKIQEVADAG